MTDEAKNGLYFKAFLDRLPPPTSTFEGRRRTMWHLTAGMTVGLGLWYLNWRWTHSLNPEALVFSIAVVLAETMAFLGTLLFFFNIWDEGDDVSGPPPASRNDVGLEGHGDILVNIYITTFDEDVELVAHSVTAARDLRVPKGVRLCIFVADDGNRPAMAEMARQEGARYFTKNDNRGFKAGNLANILFQSESDFFVVCDADTQMLPSFLEQTLGYFRDPNVAFVQVPHWFYDVPEGQETSQWLAEKFGRWASVFAPLHKGLTGRTRVRSDPFLSGSDVFFDVIQRRRNRHNASFCCGAGSIHRTEAIFSNALLEQGLTLKKTERALGFGSAPHLLPRLDLQPFRYHVSEDIFTSLQQHTNGWRSIYHPERLTRMLSPWSMDAWAIQKLKYAGGTFDIMLRSGLIWRGKLPWRTRLHYMATFWSYLSVLWMPILFMAPMISLVSGLAPVDAYSITFFMHLLPVLLINELAMSIGCKGHDIHAGRILSIATMNIQLRALVQVLRGKKPHFPPTPKNPVVSGRIRYAFPALATLGLMTMVAVYAVVQLYLGSETHSTSLVIVNLFWLGLNATALARVALAAFWRPRLPDGRLFLLAS